MMTIPDALPLARQHLQNGDPRQAEFVVREVLRATPGQLDAMLVLASARQALGDLDGAVSAYREVLATRPGLAAVCLDLGNVLFMQERLNAAAVCYREALARRPDYPQAHTNLGSVLQEQGRLAEAEACHRRALALNPSFLDALFNLANSLKEQGRDAEAIPFYREAVRLRLESPGAHLNLSLALLRSGQLAEGWTEYEWRFACGKPMPRHADRPLWDGKPAPGRTILIHAEQGLGDILMFARYVPLVQKTGARVIFEVPSALSSLLERGPKGDMLLTIGSPLPEFDFQASLLSVPGLLGTTLETIPAEVSYLEPDPGRVAHWREKLEPVRAFKIGIAWQGDPTYRWDHQRSIPLAEFARLAAIEGVRLFSLQKGHGTDQLATVACWFTVDDLGGRLDEEAGPFMDTSAIIRNLDLVISADTVLAHLAGALGKPVWLPLATAAHWAWLSERDDSPWYPTLRLFRQRQPGLWGEVFSRMAAALRERLSSDPSHLP